MTDIGLVFSPKGLLEAFAFESHFSIKYAINEILENSIADSSVGADKVAIIFDKLKCILTMVNNGAGLTKDQMDKALVLGGCGHPEGRGPSDKRSGTYHMGMWKSLAYIHNARNPAADGIRIWISRHTESTDDFKTATAKIQNIDERRGKWQSSAEEFTQSSVNISLFEETDLASRGASTTRSFARTKEIDTWRETSFDKHKTGSILKFEGLHAGRMEELDAAFNNPDITENYIMMLMRKYRNLLNQGKQIIITQKENGAETSKKIVPKPVDIVELFKDKDEKDKPIITNWRFIDLGNLAAKELFEKIQYAGSSTKRKISNYLVQDVVCDEYWMCTQSGSKREVWKLPENARRHLEEKVEMKGDEHDVAVKTTCYWSAEGKILTTLQTAYKPKLKEMGIDTKCDKDDFCRAIVGNSIDRSNVHILIRKALRAGGGGGDRRPKLIVEQTSIEYKIKPTREMDEKWGVGPNKSADAGSEGRDPNLQLVMWSLESIISVDKICRLRDIRKNEGRDKVRRTIIYPCEDNPSVRAKYECLCGKHWKYFADRDNCKCSADADTICSICRKNNGIACLCGKCDSRFCDGDFCDSTSANFWRCGAMKANKDEAEEEPEEDAPPAANAAGGEEDDDEEDDDEEDEEEDDEEDDEENDEEDEEDEEDDDGEDDDEQGGGTHGVAGYDAHNGLEKQRCLNCLNSLCGIGEGSHDECIYGINQDSGVRIEGLKSIYNDTIGQTFCPQDRMDEWKDYTNVLKLDFVQYINGIKHFINTTTNNRIRGGAKLDKLVQYFSEN